jgi:hypothetical protein
MKKVMVLIPFTDRATGKRLKADDIIEVSEERLAEIKSVNINMVLELEDVKPKTKKKKAEATE